MKTTSLAKRVFRGMLLIGIANVVITLVATELIYEDIEDTNLTLGLAEERAFIESRLHPQKSQLWQSALLTAIYISRDGPGMELPAIFHDKPIPFAAEVNVGDKAYLVSIDESRHYPGVLYLAQDITFMETREDLQQKIGMPLFTLGMMVFSLILARLASQRLIHPLQQLSRQIKAIRPDQDIKPLANKDYADEELSEIAKVLNSLLKELNAHLQREKSLIRLASHELRTPLAVISGALDVIEQRNSLDANSGKPLARIRDACDKMRADVDAILTLSRRSAANTANVDLADCARDVLTELKHQSARYAARVTLHCQVSSRNVLADPAMVRMLIRNLVQNALRHTVDNVRVSVDHTGFQVGDGGVGLPDHAQARLIQDTSAHNLPEEGLGLFIVKLICERLGWQVKILHSDAAGTTIAVRLDYDTEI